MGLGVQFGTLLACTRSRVPGPAHLRKKKCKKEFVMNYYYFSSFFPSLPQPFASKISQLQQMLVNHHFQCRKPTMSHFFKLRKHWEADVLIHYIVRNPFYHFTYSEANTGKSFFPDLSSIFNYLLMNNTQNKVKMSTNTRSTYCQHLITGQRVIYKSSQSVLHVDALANNRPHVRQHTHTLS